MLEYTLKEGIYMLEQVLERFCNNSKFINDLDGLSEYLDKFNLSYDEKNKILTDVFNYNSEMYSIIVDENKKLEQIISRSNITKERKEIPVIEEEIDIEENIVPQSIDVSSDVQRIKKTENLEDIKEMISNRNVVNTFIILNLVEEIVDIKKMLYQERNNIDDETMLYFTNEVEKLTIKVEYLKQITNRNQKKNIEIKDNSNKLIFLKTNYGNVCAYSDIKDIPIDYYEIFDDLLESIYLGKFKNLKVLAGDGPLAGVSEVKDDQARIVFDSVSKDTYVILAMFLKKVDTDAGYRAYVKNRKDLFEANEKIIVEALNNEEYLEEHEQIRKKICSIFRREKVKKMGGKNE